MLAAANTNVAAREALDGIALLPVTDEPSQKLVHQTS